MSENLQHPASPEQPTLRENTRSQTYVRKRTFFYPPEPPRRKAQSRADEVLSRRSVGKEKKESQSSKAEKFRSDLKLRESKHITNRTQFLSGLSPGHLGEGGALRQTTTFKGPKKMTDQTRNSKIAVAKKMSTLVLCRRKSGEATGKTSTTVSSRGSSSPRTRFLMGRCPSGNRTRSFGERQSAEVGQERGIPMGCSFRTPRQKPSSTTPEGCHSGAKKKNGRLPSTADEGNLVESLLETPPIRSGTGNVHRKGTVWLSKGVTIYEKTEGKGPESTTGLALGGWSCLAHAHGGACVL